MIRVKQLTTVFGHGALRSSRARWKSVKGIPGGPTLSLYSAPANEGREFSPLERAGLSSDIPGAGENDAGDIASHPQHLTVALVAAFADLAMQKIPTTDRSVRSILLPLDAR